MNINNYDIFEDFENSDEVENERKNYQKRIFKKNKYRRRFDKNLKETKLFNEIVNGGIKYRSKYIGSKGKENPYNIRYLANIIGTGYYVKGCRTGARKVLKRISAKKVRQAVKKEIYCDGCQYKKIYGNINWELI